MASLTLVAAGATLTALATGLGAVPFLFTRRVRPTWLGAANAAAAGVMAGASAALVIEAWDWNPIRAVVGVILGAAFVATLRHALPRSGDAHFGSLTGDGARKALLIVAVMTAHSVAEGVGVGVSYGGGEALGIATTLAIALHNIPEGLAISLVLIPRGIGVGAAARWSVISSLPQPLMAVPAFALVEVASAALPIGLGFAAGAMVWMAFTELTPDASRQVGPGPAAAIVATSALAMIGVQALLLSG